MRLWDPIAGLLVGPTREMEWVLAPTVYMGGIWIARPLSSKEKAQILDIREDWGAPLADHFWRLEDGGFLPCRIPMEALIQALPAMLAGVARKPEGVFAWGNQRPFGVGVRDNSLRTTALAGLYFEPADAAEVDTAAKADTDEVDTSLWAVGGDGPGLEWSRGQLRTFLYGLYCRRLNWRQSVGWTRNG